MKIVNLSNRPITETETTTIEKFARLTGTPCFAFLDQQAFAILPPVEEEHAAELADLVRERMESIDDSVGYSRFYLPEEHIMIGLPEGICAISDGESEGEPSTVLMLRHICIDACRDKQVTAIVFNYD